MSASDPPGIELIRLPDGGTIPNHPLFPVIVYRAAVTSVPEGAARAEWFERTFARNGWTDAWRNGIYPYHHYHSHTHEVLGCYSGRATVMLGGESGVTVELEAGDAVLLPAGTGHRNLGATSDFGVVGAYPDGCDCDIHYGRPDERPAVDQEILTVPPPDRDPIHGADGPSSCAWSPSGQGNRSRSPSSHKPD